MSSTGLRQDQAVGRDDHEVRGKRTQLLVRLVGSLRLAG